MPVMKVRNIQNKWEAIDDVDFKRIQIDKVQIENTGSNSWDLIAHLPGAQNESTKTLAYQDFVLNNTIPYAAILDTSMEVTAQSETPINNAFQTYCNGKTSTEIERMKNKILIERRTLMKGATAIDVHYIPLIWAETLIVKDGNVELGEKQWVALNTVWG